MDGLALKTEKLFDSVSKLDCLKPYVLAGGTALSLQLNHRQSEDLDFMKWRTTKSEKMEVDWYNIEKQLSSIGNVQKRDLLDIDHVEFYVSDVKFSFYACDKYSPVTCPIDFHNNIKLADMMSIMAMKMETMLQILNLKPCWSLSILFSLLLMIGIVASANTMRFVRISLCIVMYCKDESHRERNHVNIIK